jgi:DNA-binding transcriptional LysR family regulator
MLHAPGHAPAGLERLAVGREAMVLALPERHALAGADRLMLDEVLEQPLVIFPRRIMPSLHDAVTDLYRKNGHVPRIAQQAIQMQTIVNLVWGGIGLAWVPASVMQFCRPGVVYREAVFASTRAGSKAVALPVCETSLAWPADAMSPALARFVGFVREQR